MKVCSLLQGEWRQSRVFNVKIRYIVTNIFYDTFQLPSIFLMGLISWFSVVIFHQKGKKRFKL